MIVRAGGSWVQECDPSWRGKGSKQVYDGFNPYRGRWWNFYSRGRCLLELGLYEDAEKDFARAIKKRSRDKWDARMYGMHFIDYFPHRERGIALYFLSGNAVSTDERQNLLREAIKELRMSNSQQDSSRAKFHLNQAQKAYWAGSDVTPPTLEVDAIIYTNRSPVPVRVQASDRESGVAKICIMRANREPIVERVFELAENKIVKEVEVPINPLDPEPAVLLITGVDVVGKESEPQILRIVVDTISPSASISVNGYAELQDGRISASIAAKDDFALDRIEVGGANDVYVCHGEPEYSGTIYGKAVGDELTVHVFDRAGNAAVSSVRLGSVSGASRQRPQDQGLVHYAALFVEQETASDWEPVVPFRYIIEPRAYPAWGATAVRLHTQSHVSLNRMLGQPVAVGSRIRGRHFEFPPHVRSLGHPKETSQNVFYVDGTLYDAEDIKRITVDGSDVQGLIPRGATRVFSHKVSLTGVAVGETKSIRVEAFLRQNPDKACEEATIKVTKRADYSLGPNARCGIVVLPFTFASVTCRSLGDDPVLRKAHAMAVVALSDLEVAGKQKRFTVHDANEVIKRMEAQGAGGNPGETSPNVDEGSLLRYLRKQNGQPDDVSSMDIAICGELTRYCPKDGDRFEIRLKAIDVSANECIRFPGRSGDDTTRVLADVYGTTDKLQWYIELLAAKVGERIPRVQAQFTDISGERASIDCGEGHGLFRRMKLRVYEGSMARNEGVGRPICPAEIQKVGLSSSVIKLLTVAAEKRTPNINKRTDVAITK